MPKLFFLNDGDEIRVYADASDYAIGGYVCQVVNGVEKPIGFMSRTLVNTERRWTAIEKECYALHMTLKKFEYLLRDVPFTREISFCNGYGVTHFFFKGSAGGKVCRFLYMKHPDYNSEDVSSRL